MRTVANPSPCYLQFDPVVATCVVKKSGKNEEPIVLKNTTERHHFFNCVPLLFVYFYMSSLSSKEQATSEWLHRDNQPPLPLPLPLPTPHSLTPSPESDRLGGRRDVT